MYNVSKQTMDKFLSWNKQYAKLTVTPLVGDPFVIREDDISVGGMSIDRYSATSNSIEIGSCTSAQLTLKLRNRNNKYDLITFEGAEIFVDVSVDGIEWIPCGVYLVDSTPNVRTVMNITALDRMVYFDQRVNDDDISFPITVGNLMKLACNKCGVPYEMNLTNANANYVVNEIDLSRGISWRNIMQMCTQLLGTCGYIDHEGKFRNKWYTKADIKVDGSVRYSSEVEDSIVEYTGVSMTASETVDEEVVEMNYLSGNGYYTIDITDNFLVTHDYQSVLDNIYNTIKDMPYRPFSLSMRPAPFIYPMDIITITDTRGNEIDVPVTSVNYTLNQKTIISGVGETNTKNGYYRGNVLTGEVSQAMKAEQKKIENLVSYSVTANVLKALSAEIAKLDAKYAHIDMANIDVAEIKQLFGENATFQTLVSNIAKLGTLVAGSAAITDASVIHLTTNNFVADNGVITSAMVESLNADKITSGSIDTSKVTVGAKDDDGEMLLDGSVMQFKDESGVVRIQIGKDAQGTYNVVIRNADGNVVLDHNGITKDAVIDGLIINDMISDDTKIDAHKLNIGDIVNTINEDGTYTIESGSIVFNGESLTVAFQNVDTSTEQISNRLSTLISTVDSLKSIISSTDKDVDGKIKTLMSSIEQTANSLNISFSNLENRVDEFGNIVSDSVESNNRYFRIIDGVVHIGKEEDALELVLDSDTIDFKSRGQKTATFSPESMESDNSYIKKSLRIGNFAFLPRPDGSLDLKKVG